MSKKNFNRREFLKRAGFSLAAGAAVYSGAGRPARLFAAGREKEGFATVIDLARCAGCETCVLACRGKNAGRYPEPVEDIPAYWPRKGYEDWSKERERTDRLTPYNWLFVQRVTLQDGGEGRTLNIPRRCMHCVNPPCANLCPFGIIEKTAEGAVVIDHDYCFGGAKCRHVCPWSIPQRQAGTGLYLKIAPQLAGGGVMYKCDFCQDRISEGKVPACVAACPYKALHFGPRGEMLALARQWAAELEGDLYGVEENGGTATYYVSPVAFSLIDGALQANPKSAPLAMTPGLENPLHASTATYLKAMLIAPFAGAAAAGLAVYKQFTAPQEVEQQADKKTGQTKKDTEQGE
ncbi:MAG: 4Fe-4S dicluster domain-containing protein [Bacillota bacterium]